LEAYRNLILRRKTMSMAWVPKRCALALAGIGLAVPALAGPEPSEDSAFQVTPYVWGAGFGGTIRPLPGSPTFEVSSSFSDLLEDLGLAFFASGLARVGRFVAVADLSHTSSSRDGLVRTPIPQAPVIPAEGQLEQTSMTLLGGVRAVDEANMTVDLLAGLRAFWIRTSVAAPALGVSRSPGVDIVDPIFAGRINGRIADGWSALVCGDVGGFGAGSELTSQVLGTVNARVTSRVWLSAGYRYLMVDYRGERTRADVHLGGPIFGATITF
jgi:hypothetical protein